MMTRLAKGTSEAAKRDPTIPHLIRHRPAIVTMTPVALGAAAGAVAEGEEAAEAAAVYLAAGAQQKSPRALERRKKSSSQKCLIRQRDCPPSSAS